MKLKSTLLFLPFLFIMSFAISSTAFAQNKAPKKSANKTQVKSKTATPTKTKAKSSSNSKSTKKVSKSKPVKYVGKEFKNAVKSVKKEL